MKLNLAFANTRLLRLVSPFIAIVLLQAFFAGLSLNLLSSVRAYVGGESIWSKGQKDAVRFLQLYSNTGDEDYYRAYEIAIAIPLGDRAARLAMEQTPPDIAAAREGFLQGGNHADDINGMIGLFRNFRDLPYFKPAIEHWRATDSPLSDLTQLAATIRAHSANGRSALEQGNDYRNDIDQLNARLMPEAVGFSRTLGDGSRQIKAILTIANLLSAGLLVGLQLLHTRRFLAQRRRIENALQAEKERAQTTLASIGEAVISIDAQGCVDYMNPAAEQLIQQPLRDAKGLPLASLFRLVDETGQIEQNARGHGTVTGSHSQLLLRNDSTSVAVSTVSAPLYKDGKRVGAVLVFHDMTSEKEYIARLSWQASHDALTRLANRREFEHRLEKALQRLDHLDGGPHALMFLDLDQFKVINDTCGHGAGDRLLCEVSAVLQQHLRSEDLLARLGGDEFGVLLENCEIERATLCAERLRGAVQDLDFVWNDRAFNVTVSVGLVYALESSTAMDEIVRTADLACYMAKEKGRNRVQIHNPNDSELLHRFGEMAWVQRIHDALEEQRFCLYAQEIAALKADHEAGAHFELLLRLRDRDGRLVPPGDFIPAAERYGLMPLIDRWVVGRAFEILSARMNDGFAPPVATCAINLSGATFNDDGFIDYIREQFRIYDIPPSMICFEITETSAIADIDTANRFIGILQELGCQFSLDDFGSGMSSFGYLKHLPVDYLKIDGGFVKDMLDDPIDRAMVEMICRIGKLMGKRTIAEFVENEATLLALREIGVDYAQGYGVNRPEPFEILTGAGHLADDTRLRVA